MENNLDDYENEILKAFEEGSIERSKSNKEDIDNAVEAAKKHLKKDARINIRLSQFDLDRIKRIAVSEGLPYQTLISSILHKVADKGSVRNLHKY